MSIKPNGKPRNLSLAHIATSDAMEFYKDLSDTLQKHGNKGGELLEFQYSSTTVRNEEVVFSFVMIWELPLGVEITMDDIKQG